MKESEIQRKILDICLASGHFPIKTLRTSPSGTPDIIINIKTGAVWYCEIKKKKKSKLRDNQYQALKKLVALNQVVFIVFGIALIKIYAKQDIITKTLSPTVNITEYVLISENRYDNDMQYLEICCDELPNCNVFTFFEKLLKR